MTREQIIFRLLSAIVDLNKAYTSDEPYIHIVDAVAKLEALIEDIYENKS